MQTKGVLSKTKKNKLGMEFFDEMTNIRTLYGDFIVSQNFCVLDSGTELTWNKYERGIYRGLYSQEYMTLINKEQYSFLLKGNKGFIQIYYLFEGNTITKAKLAFYPHPLCLTIEESELEDLFYNTDGDDSLSAYVYDMWEMLNSDVHGSDGDDENNISMSFKEKYPLTNSSHIRLDYDSKVSSHNLCELQFGSINDIRLPLAKLISPLLFVDFIIKNVYIQEYQEIYLQKKHPMHLAHKKAKKASININKFNEENIFFTHT